MTRTPVTSSNIRSIGFEANPPSQEAVTWARNASTAEDYSARGTLEVEFINGSVYRYFDVPQVRHAMLALHAGPDAAGPSVGQVFDAVIKKGGYRFEKVCGPVVSPACAPIAEQLEGRR
jgi:hypothetical protein